MRHPHKKERTPGRRLLCGITLVCYGATLTSLAALGYSLSLLALTAAGQQATALYLTLGNAAR